jgi:acetyl-CoA synthetase
VSDLYPVKPHVAARSHLGSLAEYERLYRLSLDNPEWFWGEQAKAISWFHPWQSVFDADYDEVDFAWFSAGRLNASFNCVDRHLDGLGDRTAIIWAQDEPGAYRHISYRELKHNVCRVANVLLAHGIRRGDRVCIYMGMMPELVYTMLACARIGAVHSVVFGGFSSEALRDRIVDARCRMVVTANEGLRGGKRIPLKKTVDRAVEGMSMVETVLVARRTDHEVPMAPGRDLWLDEECRKQRSTCTNEWMGAEDPLFILYTSGSTGKPKGLMHTTGGYLVYAAFTHKMVFDYHPGDVYFCAADVGWITGHTYIVYGPLANGATTVMFESTPTYPDPGRYWRIVDDLGVNIFYTAPTALRALAQGGDEWVKRFRRDSLRVLGSVGEPINPEIWRWYHDVVGDGRCAVVDTWWQTETGGILITPLPGVTPTKPGSATLPFFGVKPLVLDTSDGKVLEGNGVSGALCLGTPWPGQARTVWGDHHRFKETYFTQYPGYYFTGTACGATRTGTTGSPAGSTTCSTSRATASGPRRSRARWSPTTRWRRPRWWAFPTRSRGRASTPTPCSRPSTPRRTATSCRARSRSRSGTRSAPSPRPTWCTSPPACRRRGAGRSCGASCARSPPPSTRGWATCRRWPSPRSWSV